MMRTGIDDQRLLLKLLVVVLFDEFEYVLHVTKVTLALAALLHAAAILNFAVFLLPFLLPLRVGEGVHAV